MLQHSLVGTWLLPYKAFRSAEPLAGAAPSAADFHSRTRRMVKQYEWLFCSVPGSRPRHWTPYPSKLCAIYRACRPVARVPRIGGSQGGDRRC